MRLSYFLSISVFKKHTAAVLTDIGTLFFLLVIGPYLVLVDDDEELLDEPLVL